MECNRGTLVKGLGGAILGLTPFLKACNRLSGDFQSRKEKQQIKKILSELVTSQKLAVLATHQKGQPYGSLVAFAATSDLENLVFATMRATRKFANLEADPRVSLVLDNRSNRVVDFRKAVAATALGRAREVRGKEREKLAAIYFAKHPHLKDFVNSPTCALVKVRVEVYYVVWRFQNVFEWRVGR